MVEENQIDFAIVVGAGRTHFEAAGFLLDHRVPVLVEKPLALEKEQVKALVDSAVINSVALVSALTFRHCSYLENFREYVKKHNKPVKGLSLKWWDSAGEIRYGENKAYDPSLSVVQDVMPHVWSLFSTLDPGFRKGPWNIDHCQIRQGGRCVEFFVEVLGIHYCIDLRREAKNRSRIVEVEFIDGDSMRLDFSLEPGTIFIGSQEISADPDWESSSEKPIRRLLQSFLSQTPGVKTDYTDETSLVELLQKADGILKVEQLSSLNFKLEELEKNDVVYAISEIIAEKLFSKALVVPGDHEGFRREGQKFVDFLSQRSGGDETWSRLIEQFSNSYFH